MTIEWKDSFKLGDDKLDAQHQHLFELAKKMLATDDLAQLRALAQELYKHTRIHFEDEEALMRHNNYPMLASHIVSHNRLLERLTDLSLQIGKGRVNKAAIEALMADWALFHIPLEDARFEDYLRPTA